MFNKCRPTELKPIGENRFALNYEYRERGEIRAGQYTLLFDATDKQSMRVLLNGHMLSVPSGELSDDEKYGCAENSDQRHTIYKLFRNVIRVFDGNLAGALNLDGELDGRICFYGLVGDTGYLSNFYRAPFVYAPSGLSFATVEHFYQAYKASHDKEHFTAIRTAATPAIAKKLGRVAPLSPEWNDRTKVLDMLCGVSLKFQTHFDLAMKLIGTGNKMIVEASPTDYFWGIGKEFTGQNMLGVILEYWRDTTVDNIQNAPVFSRYGKFSPFPMDLSNKENFNASIQAIVRE
jgi:ribA/ribD-fused uncharacterized protein